MKIKEITAKTILTKSQIYNYTINPYVGCGHACAYCYAAFMKRFSGHKEPWGEFVDVKINAPKLLEKELSKIPKGKIDRVWLSGICDPYQPLEKKYLLTRSCVEILIRHNWPFTIQTKSALVLRDLDLLTQTSKAEVTITMTTADEKIRKIFEPYTSTTKEKLFTLKKLKEAGITTDVMIAPILPGVLGLPEKLEGLVDSVLIDRLNYHYADAVYKRLGLEEAMSDDFFENTKKELKEKFKKYGIKSSFLY